MILAAGSRQKNNLNQMTCRELQMLRGGISEPQSGIFAVCRLCVVFNTRLALGIHMCAHNCTRVAICTHLIVYTRVCVCVMLIRLTWSTYWTPGLVS